MTPSEAKLIYDTVFEAFPYMRSFLGNTENPQATIDTWKEMILPLNFAHAQQAVGLWKSGELEPPDKPWEMGMLPLKIRAVASKIADAAAKTEKDRKLVSDTQERLAATKRSIFPRLLRLSLVSGAALRDGQITSERNKEIVADLLSQLAAGRDDVREPEELKSYLRKRSQLNDR
jgi:hypothetical protein